MQIDGYGNIKAATSLKKRVSTTGMSDDGGFSDLLDVSSAEEIIASGVHDASPANSLSGLFAFQEISDIDVNRKKLVRRGQEILDELDNLRRGLLLGTLSPAVLRDINQKLINKRQEFNDPKLAAILDEIELRAAVELAKLETHAKFN